MSTDLVVLAFEGEQAAYYVLKDIEKIEEGGGFTIVEAVTAARYIPDDDSGIDYDQQLAESAWRTPAAVYGNDLVISYAHKHTGRYVLGGGGIGLLAGLLLGGPIGGLVVGVTAGGIASSLNKRGIDKDFVYEVGESIAPGRSALFLLVEDMTQEAELHIADKLRDREPTVMTTTLSPEHEQALRSELSAHYNQADDTPVSAE